MGDLYDVDVLEWSKHQARLLQRHAAGEKGNEVPDWANIIEEIISVGRNELRAVRSLLVLALLHDLKSKAWPSSRDVPHWQKEARSFRREAQQDFTPSMRQNIDVAALYAIALDRLPEDMGGHLRQPVPETCPVTLDELVGVKPWPSSSAPS